MLERRWQNAIVVWWWIWWNTNATEKETALSLSHTEYRDISAAQKHTDAIHFLCYSPKTMQLNFLIFIVFVFFLSSLWNYPLWVHPTSVKRGYIPCFPTKGWPASPHPPPPLFTKIAAAILHAAICSLHRDKKASCVTLLECAKLKQSPRINRTLRANLTVTPCYCGVLSRFKSLTFSADPCSKMNQWAKST